MCTSLIILKKAEITRIPDARLTLIHTLFRRKLAAHRRETTFPLTVSLSVLSSALLLTLLKALFDLGMVADSGHFTIFSEYQKGPFFCKI